MQSIPVTPKKTIRSTIYTSKGHVEDESPQRRKHVSCEGCRQKKMKCSRTFPCLSCKMRNERCLWDGAVPKSLADEEELEATQSEVTRLRALVDVLVNRLAIQEQEKESRKTADRPQLSNSSQQALLSYSASIDDIPADSLPQTGFELLPEYYPCSNPPLSQMTCSTSTHGMGLGSNWDLSSQATDSDLQQEVLAQLYTPDSGIFHHDGSDRMILAESFESGLNHIAQEELAQFNASFAVGAAAATATLPPDLFTADLQTQEHQQQVEYPAIPSSRNPPESDLGVCPYNSCIVQDVLLRQHAESSNSQAIKPDPNRTRSNSTSQ